MALPQDTDQLVTLSGLNTVWSATKGLYNYLDKRLDNIASFYQYKGVKATWSALLNTSATKGEAYSVTSDYPEDDRDPESYPAWSSGMPPRVYICTEDTSGSGTSDASKWAPVGFNVPMASATEQGIIIQNNSYAADASTYGFVKRSSDFVASSSNYGFIKTGFSDSNANTFAVELGTGTNADKAFVTVPAGGDGSDGNIGLLKTGSGINNSSGVISIAVDSADGSGISLDGSNGSYTIHNTGIRGITDKNGSTPLSSDSVKISTPDNQTDNNAGKIKFEKAGDSNSSFEVQVSGWNATDWNAALPSSTFTDTAVTHTKDKEVGSASKPVFVASDGKATKINTLVLNGSADDTNTTGNVATFTAATSGNTDHSVKITGPSTSDNADPGETSKVALYVTGAAKITSALSAGKVYHAVWNDVSDAIEVQDTLSTDPGYCYYFDGTEYHRTTKYCQKGIIGIHSDTAGSVLGRKGKHKELDISVGGFVLAYVDKYYESGTPLTSDSDGRLTKMSLWSRVFHPERLVATYWKPEMEAEWGDEIHTVEVNGRHWVKIK